MAGQKAQEGPKVPPPPPRQPDPSLKGYIERRNASRPEHARDGDDGRDG